MTEHLSFGPPPEEEIRDQWDAIAQEYDQRIRDNEIQNNVVVGSILQSLGCDAQSVLDLGSGTGHTVDEITKHTQPENIVAVDISPRMLAELRRKYPDYDQMLLVQTSVESYLQQTSATFDVITAVCILPHMATPSTIIEGGKDHIRQGGYLLFTYEPIIVGHPTQGQRETHFRHHLTSTPWTIHRQYPHEIGGLVQEHGFQLMIEQLYAPLLSNPSQVACVVAARKI